MNKELASRLELVCLTYATPRPGALNVATVFPLLSMVELSHLSSCSSVMLDMLISLLFFEQGKRIGGRDVPDCCSVMLGMLTLLFFLFLKPPHSPFLAAGSCWLALDI